MHDNNTFLKHKNVPYYMKLNEEHTRVPKTGI